MSRKPWFFVLAMIAGAAWEISAAADDLTGDRLILRTTVSGFGSLRDDSKTNGVALRGTKLRVIKDEGAGKSGGQLVVAVESIPCVIGEDGKNVRRDRIHIGVGGLADCKGAGDIDKLIRLDEAYKISRDTIEQHGYYRSGWVYGALLVPYKYHRHDKSFSSATTIGPYLGYRMGGFGFDTAFVGATGIATLSVPNASGGSTTLQGYTAAIGIIGSVTKNSNPLRLGILIGRDWAGSNSAVPYEHEGRTWFAAQIGFSFGQ